MFGSIFTTKSLFEIDLEKRVFGFDFLRALAIFFVVHGHTIN
jgi:peptidoglycan/LPS O-acetylase OafA/YrhL